MFKKFLPAVIIFLFLSNISFAQIQISIWGGMNNSSFGGNPPEDASFESVYGLSLGADLNFNLTDDVMLSLEPSYDQQGSKVVFGDEEKLRDTVLTYTIKQNYFGLGAIFKVNTERFFVGCGLNFQLLSSANLKFESEEKDITDKFINYNLLAFFNVGYKIPIGIPSIFIELRYIQGLININDESPDAEAYVSNFKSTGLKLSTGIMFPL